MRPFLIPKPHVPILDRDQRIAACESAKESDHPHQREENVDALTAGHFQQRRGRSQGSLKVAEDSRGCIHHCPAVELL